MTVELAVENIKCGGCANGIRKQLLALDGVERVEVDIERGEVVLQLAESASSETVRPLAAARLLSMGYPEVGSVEGLRATGAKAKSFVSCAVGKLTDEH